MRVGILPSLVVESGRMTQYENGAKLVVDRRLLHPYLQVVAWATEQTRQAIESAGDCRTQMGSLRVIVAPVVAASRGHDSIVKV